MSSVPRRAVPDAADEVPFGGRERLALGLMAVAPAVFLPGGLDRFVFLKVAVAGAACALATWPFRRGVIARPLAVVVGMGGLALLVAALTSVSVTGAVLGRSPRYEGVFVLTTYAACFGAGAWLLGPGRRRGAMPWWLRWLAVAAAAIALEAILETAGLRPLASDVARPGSLLGNASDEGAVGVLMLGPLGGAAVTTRDPWCIGGALASAATVVLSASRGALLAVVPLAIVLAVAIALGRPGAVASGRKVVLGIGVTLLAVAGAAFALPLTRTRILAESPLAADTASGRLLLWRESLRLVGAHAGLGVGPSGFLDAIGVDHSRTWQVRFGAAYPPDSPHNWLLQAASAGGIVLAVLAVAFGVLVLVRGWRAVPAQPSAGERGAFAGLLAGLVGYGTALLFHLTSPGTTPLAAFCAGALVAVPAAGRVRADGGVGAVVDRWRHLVVAVVMGGLTVLLVAAACSEIPLKAAIGEISSGRLAAAQHDFQLAHDLRPWDDEIAATAGHAFVVAAQADAAAAGVGPGSGEVGAAGAGAGTSAAHGELVASRRSARLAQLWVTTELDAYPDSIQSLEDQAALDQLAGRVAAAASLLQRAAHLDPLDPQILLGQGLVAEQARAFGKAERFLTEAGQIDPSSSAIRQALNDLGKPNPP